MPENEFYLGIETSQLATSVAIARGSKVLGSRELSQEHNQRARLVVSEIKTLLEEHNLKPQELGSIFVSLGPGSFTGLRIGIMVAKTLAFATGVIVKGVPTFQILADQVSIHEKRMIVVSDAQRGDVFYQEYAREPEYWRAASNLSIVNWKVLCEQYVEDSGVTLVTGPGLNRFQLTEGCQLEKTSTDAWLPKAAQTILTGRRELKLTGHDDTLQLGPIYIRPSAAEEKFKSAI